MYTIYRIAYYGATISYPVWREQQRPGGHKSFTHIQHRAGAVGREGFVPLIPVSTPEYVLPSQLVPVVTPT